MYIRSAVRIIEVFVLNNWKKIRFEHPNGKKQIVYTTKNAQKTVEREIRKKKIEKNFEKKQKKYRKNEKKSKNEEENRRKTKNERPKVRAEQHS